MDRDAFIIGWGIIHMRGIDTSRLAGVGIRILKIPDMEVCKLVGGKVGN